MKAPRKILIAYDGSKASDAALADLKLAGLPARCECKIVTVADLWIPPANMTTGMAEGWYAQAYETLQQQAKTSLKEAKELAEKAERTVQKNFPEWKVSVAAMVDHPAQAILDVAKKFKAQLIIMGSHGHGALGRIFLGSTSLKVLHHAHCAVRIVREKKTLPKSPKILLGIDGSRDSRAAVEAVATRNWPLGTSVHLVTVVDERMRLSGAVLTKLAKPKKGFKAEGWLENLLATAEDSLRESGLKVSQGIFEGDARKVLLDQITEFKPNAVFLGSRGLNALQRFFLGSVSTDIVVHAPCTVEIDRLD
jgi:nucleotide-binding universal stress UspA family protein